MKKAIQIAIYISVLLLGQVLLTQVSFAEEENNVDQRCWTKADCEGSFGTFVGPNPETIQACKMEKDATNNQIGFCLPTTKAQMGLNWGEAGGQTSTFTHIGDFIKWIYKYGIVVAGVLAVMRIIAAGFDWVMSGGSQEKVTGAHKKIGGALMGLFLVLMAYTVLNLINPYLVNFRLPGIWMINSAGLVPPYCDAIKDKTFYPAKEASAEKFENTFATAMQQGFQAYDKIQPKCGWEYYVEGAGGATCSGVYCGEDQLCMPKNNSYVCLNGRIGGKIYASNFAEDTVINQFGAQIEGWTWPWVVGEIQIEAVCKDGSKSGKLASTAGPVIENGEQKIQSYLVSIGKSVVDMQVIDCKSSGGLKGFVLDTSFNEAQTSLDEDHMIGANGVDLGDYQFGGSDAFGQTFVTADDEYFISREKLKEGLIIDINVSRVCDIDSESEDRPVCYGYLGWKNK